MKIDLNPIDRVWRRGGKARAIIIIIIIIIINTLFILQKIDQLSIKTAGINLYAVIKYFKIKKIIIVRT